MKKLSILFILLVGLMVNSAESATQQTILVNVPVGQTQVAALEQYDSYVVGFKADAGDHISIAFGVGSRNDLFVGVADSGLLLPAQNPIKLQLWQIGSSIYPSNQSPIASALYAYVTDLGNGSWQLSISNFSAEIALTPGILHVHQGGQPIFSNGQADRGQGLRQLASGNPQPLFTNLQNQTTQPPIDPDQKPAETSHVLLFDTAVGSTQAAALQPGQSYEVTFTAQPGDHLSYATMLVETNDFFFAPNGWGVPLYDSAGQPRYANLTKYTNMFDAGTEVNERPGSGPNQPARQASPNTGPADPNRAVRFAHDSFGPIPLGNVETLIEVVLRPTEQPNTFLLRIRNVSGGKTLSPGVALIHRDYAPLFDIGHPDYGLGLEALAEDGNPYPLAQSLRQKYR